jgi:hypothetical protein
MEQLKQELEKCKNSYAYGQNHLLDTIIARVDELLDNKTDSDIVIGY